MQLDDRTVDIVMEKLFKNYKIWCKFLGRKHSLRWDISVFSVQIITCLLIYQYHQYYFLYDIVVWILILCSICFLCRCRLPQGQQEIQQRKILYVGLYLLIWGEAANVRFFQNVYAIFSIMWVALDGFPFPFLFNSYVLEFCFSSISVTYSNMDCVDGLWTPWPIGWKCQHSYWWKY